MSGAAAHITSRDNPQVREWRRLAREPSAYREAGRVWLEGEHLCEAAAARGLQPAAAVLSETKWAAQRTSTGFRAIKTIVLPDAVFASISALPSPSGVACVIALPAAAEAEAGVLTVVLDRVQDAGNVGSVLRSAAAFGFRQVVALEGTAALWSGKVLRAGMGAHFALRLVEGASPSVLDELRVPLLTTDSHAGAALEGFDLPDPCAWVFGNEGAGVGAAVAARATAKVRIAQPGGEESLNVAAAAAICLHASRARPVNDARRL